MARPEGFEPPAYRFEVCRSIQLSYGRVKSTAILHQPCPCVQPSLTPWSLDKEIVAQTGDFGVSEKAR